MRFEEGKWPEPDEIKARCFEFGNDEDLLTAVQQSLHRWSNFKVTRELAVKALKCAEENLQSDIDRYNDLRKFGDAVVSKTDLKMNYTAQNCCLRLKYAHIGYSRGKVEILKNFLKGKPTQGSLF